MSILLSIAAAWAFTCAAYLVHATVVLPVVVLLAVASLLRGGQTFLDRIMLAMGLLLGTVCAAGLVFAAWPWGLHPIPVTGTAFTALIGGCALTGRRPNLPRPRLADVLSVGAAAVVGVFVAWPLVGANQVQRLSVVITGEDFSRHVTVFDAIRQTGGYLFQHWNAAADYVFTGMITYPQGSHLLAALLDGFVRSNPHEFGSGPDAIDHYLGFVIAGYVFLTLTMIWAAQWLAGANLTLGRRIVVIAVIAGSCAASDLVALLVWGYPSETIGLAEMVLLVALLARPTVRTRQQLLLVASLVVAVGFTYYLYLPAAGLAALVWLLRHRRQLRRHRVALVLTALVAGPLATAPLGLGLTIGRQGHAVLDMTTQRYSRDLLLALTCAVVAGVGSRGALRSRIWRSYVWCLMPIGVLAGTLMVVQRAGGGGNGYYANKTLHLAGVALLIGIGSLALHLPAPRRHRMPIRQMMISTAPGICAAVAIIAGFGLVRGDSPYQPIGGTNWGRYWFNRTLNNEAAARTVLGEYQAQSGQPPVATLIWNDDNYESYARTLFLAMLDRTSGKIGPGLYLEEPAETPDHREHQVLALTVPIRIVAYTDQAAKTAQQIKDRHPERQIDIVRSG